MTLAKLKSFEVLTIIMLIGERSRVNSNEATEAIKFLIHQRFAENSRFVGFSQRGSR
jgi:hypothetical protein